MCPCPFPGTGPLLSAPCWAHGALPATPECCSGPAKKEQRQQQEQQPPAKTTLPSPYKASHGEHMQWRQMVLALPAVPSLGTCRGECDGKLDFSARNSSLPLCKELEQDLSPTNEPLQFWCGGLCVSLSGAQGQILLIKS